MICQARRLVSCPARVCLLAENGLANVSQRFCSLFPKGVKDQKDFKTSSYYYIALPLQHYSGIHTEQVCHKMFSRLHCHKSVHYPKKFWGRDYKERHAEYSVCWLVICLYIHVMGSLNCKNVLPTIKSLKVDTYN